VQRWLFKRELEQLDPLRVYYMDESGIDRRLYREKGRAPRGEKLHQTISGKLRKRTSVTGAWKNSRLVAPMVFEGSCTSSLIDAYFEQVLLPELPPGSILVLDNASFHRASNAGELARIRGVSLMFLPVYSPDLNPIEHFWAVFKRALRAVLPSSNDPVSTISDMCLCYC
jgi:transposase